MNNMRRGFTMIELIFVIVIIGILAAVAIPKLAGTAEEAKKSIYQSFMGTLNRSVGPAMWADKIATANGSVTSIATLADFQGYSEIPKGLTAINLSLCKAPGIAPVSVAKLLKADTGLPIDIDIFCNDGTPTQAPKFGWSKSTDGNETNATFPIM